MTNGLVACFPVYNNKNTLNYLLSGAGEAYIKGAAHLIGWNQVETSPGVYDWTIADNLVNQWGNSGKPSVLLLAPTSYGGTNRYMPSWYHGPVFDSNTSSACGNGILPVYWNSYFKTNWQAFIAEAVGHYDNNPYVVGIRPGFGIGFENFACNNASDNTKSPCGALLNSVGYSTANWIAYLQEMADYLISLKFPDFQWSLCYTNHGKYDPTSVQTISDFAAPLGMFVSAGLQQSDKSSTTGSNDWLDIIKRHPEVPMGQQPLGLSDPSGTAPQGSNSQLTGSLTTLLPWTVQQGVKYLEIYANDLLATWCPSNINPGYDAAQEAGYVNTIENIAGRINY